MTDPPGKPPGESQIIETDECCSSNDASLLKTSNLGFFLLIINTLGVVFLFLTKNNGKPSDLKARHRRSWKDPSL